MTEYPVIVTTMCDLPLDAEDLGIVIRNPVLVAMGEYADDGEPDVLVHVVHAINGDGHDVRQNIAKFIASALQKPGVADVLDGSSGRGEGSC